MTVSDAIRQMTDCGRS